MSNLFKGKHLSNLDVGALEPVPVQRKGSNALAFRQVITDGISAGLTNRQIQDKQREAFGTCNLLKTIGKYREEVR